ncbi:MAG TPA: 4'-phosphopantetheinyl transferase superfamily protein [Thermoanaerobaculia bacterium]|nr:4'-phosphopantetheinyl transferase superfamily protein [Thermoanaerobaculia bacterium]
MNVVASWPGRALVVTGEPDESLFTAGELAKVRAFKLEKRRREWLLSRMAAKQLGLAPFVSFSHSAPYAAAMIGDAPVGIDVQTIRDVDERTAHLFLTDDETLAMQRCTLAHRLLHFWCAKEAEWKRRGGATETLKRTALALADVKRDGLLFDQVETFAIDDFIVAITRPTF